jgi:hypothetical protein
MTSLTDTVMHSPFTEQMLDDFRKQGDPLADEVIEVFATQYTSSIPLLIENLENMIRMPNDDEILEQIKKQFSDNTEISKALEKYFTLADQSPDWADNTKLTLGGHVFQDHFFTSTTALACASLPVCYVCQPDVKVLSFTRRFIDKAPIRIAETAQMVTDVMGHGGITIKDGHLSGKGIQSVLKIRLIHASIRYLLLNKEQLLSNGQCENAHSESYLMTYILESTQDKCCWYGDKKPSTWNLQTDGTPINQEATALALLTFSYIILRGLKTIGVKLNSLQQEAYLHSWNVVGYILGVDENFLKAFESYEKAEVIYNQIISRRRGYTEDGALLQQALLSAFATTADELMPIKGIFPFRYLAKLTTSILLPKESYAALGLKLRIHDYFFRFIIYIFLRVVAIFVNIGFLRPIADTVFKYIARSLWGWRDEIKNNNKKAKEEICNPLIVPHHLIKSSHLSGKYKS